MDGNDIGALVVAAAAWPAGLFGAWVLTRAARGPVRAGWVPFAVTGCWLLLAAAQVVGVVPGRWVPLLAVLAWLAVVLGCADAVTGRLPDAVTLPAYPLLAGVAVLAAPAAWWRIALGAVLLGGVHLLVHRCRPGALGGGDVKLVGALGLAAGACGWAALCWLAPVAAVFTGLGAVATRRRVAPHGPGLLGAALLLALARVLAGSP